MKTISLRPLLLLAPLLGTPLSAGTRQWNGHGLTALWSNNANWNPNTAPGGGDSLVFPAGASRSSSTLDVTGAILPHTFPQLTFETSHHLRRPTANAPQLQVSSGIAVTAPGASVVIDCDFSWSQQITLSAVSLSSLVIDGDLVPTGWDLLTVTGDGTVKLRGDMHEDTHITRTGTGTLVLSGLMDAFESVSVEVISGTLQLDGNGSTLSVDLGAGGELTGYGHCSTLFARGGRIRPGGSAAGTLYCDTAAGFLTPPGAQPAVLEIGIHGPESLAAVDRLVIGSSTRFDPAGVPPSANGAGPLDRGRLEVALDPAYAPAEGEVFMAVEILPLDAPGHFLNLPEGATVESGGKFFGISYTGGDGNDVTLTVLHAPPGNTAINTAPGGLLHLTSTGKPAAGYFLQGSPDLQTWSTLQHVHASLTGAVSVDVNPGHAPRGFYRFLPAVQ